MGNDIEGVFEIDKVNTIIRPLLMLTDRLFLTSINAVSIFFVEMETQIGSELVSC